MKKTMLGVCLLCLSVAIFGVIPLKDVTPSHWAYESVQYLIEKGILTGLPDGSFQGEAYLTRYQFSVAMYKAFQLLERNAFPGEVTSTQDLSTINFQVSTLKGLVETIAAKMERMGRDYQDLAKQIDQVGTNTELVNQVAQTSQLLSGLETRVIDLELENDSVISKLAALERQLTDHRRVVENTGLEYQNLNTQHQKLNQKVNILLGVA
ncbi:MAG: S-layer homology domain-containing protein, partial [Thermotogota bacterium]|nr:S-layer homology domain-containing protein [Thermotogota bacterium]